MESNDVWSTLGLAATVYGDVQKAKYAATTAAPSGRPSSTNQNPGPGGFGPYPQAQTKTSNGGAMPSSISDALSMGLGKSSNITLLLIAAFLVVVLAVLRR